MNNIQFFLIIFFVQKIFFKNYFLIITDGYIVGHNSSVYSRGKGNNLLHMHYNTVTSSMKLFRRYFIEGWNKITINATANHRRHNSNRVLKWVIFFGSHIPSVKTSSFVLPIE